MTPNDLLITPEVAEMLRTTPAELAQARHEGRDTPPWHKVGRRVLYRRRDVERWLEAHRVEPQRAS